MFASPNRLGKDAARDAIKSALEADVGYCRPGHCKLSYLKLASLTRLQILALILVLILDAANVLTWPRQDKPLKTS
jgi:hypothetical protein